VLRHISARLMPDKNSALPDCICLILLTDDTLYVLENEFDGTYITHFAIPCSRIKRVEKYRQESASIKSNKATGFMFALAFALLSQKASQETVSEDFLLIVFHDGANENQHLYFHDAAGSISGFSKAFQKLKSRSL